MGISVEHLMQVAGMGQQARALIASVYGRGSVTLNREEILKHHDVATETVNVPEWGGDVIVRGMTGRERDAWEASMFMQRGNKLVASPDNTRAKLVARCVVDETGKRLFSDGDIEALGDLPASGLSKVYDVAARLSGVTEDDLNEMVSDFGKAPGGSFSLREQSNGVPPSDGSSTTLIPGS